MLLWLFISFIFIIRKKEKEKKEEEKDFISRGFVTVFGISDPNNNQRNKNYGKELKSVKNVKNRAYP